jgi:hypothetical protein
LIRVPVGAEVTVIAALRACTYSKVVWWRFSESVQNGSAASGDNGKMSIQQAAAQALASVQRAQALFGSSPVPPGEGGPSLATAVGPLAGAGQRASVLSGDVVESHQSFVNGATTILHANNDADTALGRALAQAATVTQQGRARLDDIVSRTRSLAQSAATTRGASAQRTLLQALQTEVSNADAVVKATKQQSSAIAGQVRALDYQSGGGTQGGGPAANETGDGIQLVDSHTATGPPQPGPLPDPDHPFVGDQRFGHWEAVPPPPPYTGSRPPPLTPQYRPFPDGTPLKVGPTTGMYTPGKTWIGDIDPPAVQGQEEYRFKLAGEQATTSTRNVFENGHWQQERWVQNVYEYQRNTSMVLGGDIGLKGIDGEGGDLGGLPPIQNIDRAWKPISLPQISGLSGNNADTTYYLPDGCGGSVKVVGGVPQGSSGLPPSPPVMTRPR